MTGWWVLAPCVAGWLGPPRGHMRRGGYHSDVRRPYPNQTTLTTQTFTVYTDRKLFDNSLLVFRGKSGEKFPILDKKNLLPHPVMCDLTDASVEQDAFLLGQDPRVGSRLTVSRTGVPRPGTLSPQSPRGGGAARGTEQNRTAAPLALRLAVSALS